MKSPNHAGAAREMILAAGFVPTRPRPNDRRERFALPGTIHRATLGDRTCCLYAQGGIGPVELLSIRLADLGRIRAELAEATGRADLPQPSEALARAAGTAKAAPAEAKP